MTAADAAAELGLTIDEYVTLLRESIIAALLEKIRVVREAAAQQEPEKRPI